MTSYSEHAEYLSNVLTQKQHGFRISADYYNATYRPKTIGLAAPPELRKLNSAMGWPRLYVDSLEERLDGEGFRLAGKSEQEDELWEWWQANGLDEESGLSHIEAMIYGRSYVTVAAPGPDDPQDVPLIRVESPLYMVADTDPRTLKVTRAFRLYQREYSTGMAGEDPQEDEYGTLYLPDRTVYLRRGRDTGTEWVTEDQTVHKLGIVPVVPMVNRESLASRDGRSEITEELRSLTDAASRTMMNLQAAAELMAMPQRYIFGVDPRDLAPNGTAAEIWQAYTGRILAITDPEGKAGQFQSAELQNYVNALQEMSKQFAAYCGLPPQYLSFSSDNPASAEAIRSAEARLVRKCERKTRAFGGAWEEVMRTAMKVMGRDVPEEYARLEMIWKDPSTPTFAAQSDATTKLVAGGILPVEYARRELGYTEEQIKDMDEMDKRAPTTLDAVLASSERPFKPTQTVDQTKPTVDQTQQKPNQSVS